MNRSGPGVGTRRRAVAAGAVALVVLLAGCGILGGGGSGTATPADNGGPAEDGDPFPPKTTTSDGQAGTTDSTGDKRTDTPTEAPSGPDESDTPTPTPPGSGPTPTATPADPTSTATPTATATPAPPALSEVLASPDERAAASFTVSVDTLINDTEPGVVVENRTVRRGANGTAFAETRRRVTGPNASTLLIESYTTAENGTYVRTTTPDANASTYQHLPAGSGGNGSGVAALGEGFDFDYAPTGDGGHRYTVDSADQIAGETAWNGEVRNVSIVVVVDESGIVTELRYDVTVDESDGTFEYRTDRRVTRRGSTTVTVPAWLPEAKLRTPP